MPKLKLAATGFGFLVVQRLLRRTVLAALALGVLVTVTGVPAGKAQGDDPESRGRFDWSRKFSAKGGHAVSADFNLDGRPDLAIHREGETVLLLNKGDRDFEELTGLGVPAGDNHIVADFDGNGVPDLLNHKRGAYGQPDLLTISLGDRIGYGGGFKEATQFGLEVNNSFSLRLLTLGDFDGDDIVDLVVVNGNAFLYSGKGDGTFESRERLDIDSISGPMAGTELATSGDFNGDGARDLAIATTFFESGGTTQVFLGNGDGSFQEGKRVAGGHNPSGFATGDFNGDGITGIAVAIQGKWMSRPWTVYVSVVLSDPDGSFGGGGVDGRRPVALAAEDFDGDGLVDLMVSEGFYEWPEGWSRLKLYRGRGNGEFHTPTVYKLPPDYLATGLLADDFDGDGLNDLLLGRGGLRLLWNAEPIEPEREGPGPWISRSEDTVTVTWNDTATLQTAASADGPWTDSDQSSPATFSVDQDQVLFMRTAE